MESLEGAWRTRVITTSAVERTGIDKLLDALAEAEGVEHLGALVAGELGGFGFELHAHADHLGPLAKLGLHWSDHLGDAVQVVLFVDSDPEPGTVVGEHLERGDVVGRARPRPVQVRLHRVDPA